MVEVKHDVLQETISEIENETQKNEQMKIEGKEKRKKSMLGFMEMEIPF